MRVEVLISYKQLLCHSLNNFFKNVLVVIYLHVMETAKDDKNQNSVNNPVIFCILQGIHIAKPGHFSLEISL